MTPTPSSVITFQKSADARVGQLFNNIRTSDMLGDAKGQNEQLKVKRKLELDKGETFSPKKLPKLNISKNILSSTRLGGDPGKGDKAVKGTPSTN